MSENTLTITKQYPAEKYNLLVPMQTVAEIADIHKLVMNVVQISTDPTDKEIYLQEKACDEYKDRRGNYHPAKKAGWALTKKGLNRLMRAAGIKILGTRPIIPSTCQKCAEINKGIGRPVNCGVCGNKDVKFEARISVPQLTGENIEIVAHKEIVAEDVMVGMTDAQKQEFLKFRSEMCETKAINRALRAAMHIKGTYTIEELRKPFVVAYLVPNLDNEDVKAEAVRHMFSSVQEIYGGYIPNSHHSVFVDGDADQDVYGGTVEEADEVSELDARQVNAADGAKSAVKGNAGQSITKNASGQHDDQNAAKGAAVQNTANGEAGQPAMSVKDAVKKIVPEDVAPDWKEYIGKTLRDAMKTPTALKFFNYLKDGYEGSDKDVSVAASVLLAAQR